MNLTIEELQLVIAALKTMGLQGRVEDLRRALAVQASALVKLQAKLERKRETQVGKKDASNVG